MVSQKDSSIDIARGIAILLVILVHTSQLVPGITDITIKILSAGQLGVQLFFVVSAYTLCMSYERRQNESVRVKSFYVRRLFRIAPLYYVGIIFYFIVRYIDFNLNSEAIFTTQNYTFVNVMANVLFVHGFVPSANNTIVPGGWSIGTEMAFYLMFPLLYPLVSRFLAAGTTGYLLLVLVGLLVVNVVVQRIFMVKIFDLPFYNNSFLYFNIVNQFSVFLIGMASYFYFRGATGGRGVCIFTGVSFLALLFVWFWSSKSAPAVLPAVAALFFAGVVELLRRANLRGGIIARIGQLSFSMYIFHFVFAWNVIPLVFNAIDLEMPVLARFAISYVAVLGCTMAVASLSEYWVESPGIRLGRKVVSHLQRKAAVHSTS